ncbi:Methylmalonyl-CoA mutase [subsurface metagenome]
MMSERKVRVLLAKPGLDGHDRGVKILQLGLMQEGIEVIYGGIRQTPESIAQTAIAEDVDIVGLSSLSGAHNALFPRVVKLLREKGAGDIRVIGGGIIPEEDIPSLNQEGISAVFGPGTSIKVIADFIKATKRGHGTE